MAKSPLEKDIQDDLCVRRETIMSLFHPPPGKSTFHKWINKGLIVMARGLRGYYLLNATRVRLGMNPVDVKQAREELLTPQAEKKQTKPPPVPIEIRGNPPDYMTVKEAAIYLTVSDRFLRGQIAEHRIQFAKANDRVIMRRKDLDRFVERNLKANRYLLGD